MFGSSCSGSSISVATRRKHLKTCLRVWLVVEYCKGRNSGTANKRLFSGPATDHHSGTGQL